MKKRRIHVVPCVVVFDGQGEVLLLKRSRKKRYGGKWEIPGGSLKFGETPREAASRELEEETGFKIRPVDLIPVDTFSFVYGYGSVQFIIPLYAAFHSGEPVLRPEEHDDWGWFTVEDIRQMETRGETLRGVYLMTSVARRVVQQGGGWR